MRFSVLISLVASVFTTTHAFVMIQTCNGVNTGSPCINWQGTLPSKCFNLADMGQDNIVSSVTLSLDVACTLYVDPGCTGSFVTLTKTFTNLPDVGLDNVVSSFRCVSTLG
ncbi:hypothetical protein B0H19DRAFT_1253657 [Mycena capillaripes]|nr:hypothetical protein B0H19DRAFT_1253657 [Mycena capillaripes]